MNIDIIGTIYNLDFTDPENVITTPLDGYHVNTTEPVEGLEAYLVEPTVPRRVFAGHATYCYKFENEVEARRLLQLNQEIDGME